MPVSPLVEHPAALLHTVLESSPTAVALLRPLYAAAPTTSTDFAWEYLNPAGQRLLAQPAASLRTLFPSPNEDSVFACCQQALLTDAAQYADTRLAAASGPGPLRLAAQRHEQLVVVYFTPLPAEAARLADAGPVPAPKVDALHQQELARIFA